MLNRFQLLPLALPILVLSMAGCGSPGDESSEALPSKEIMRVRAFADSEETEPIVSLRARSGQSPTELGSYAVTVTLLRIPCAGRIDFSAAGENLATGDSSTYSARFNLSRPQIASASTSCGTRVPSSTFGKGIARMFNASRELLMLNVHRASRSSFRGQLHLLGLPSCAPNLLVVTLWLDGKRQRYEYVTELDQVSRHEQGQRKALTLEC